MDEGCGVVPLAVVFEVLLLCISLVVAARVVGLAALQHGHGDADDHGEPEEGDALEEEKSGEEAPFDAVVPAYDAVWVLEGVEEVAEAVGCGERSLDGAVLAAVAAVLDLVGDVGVDGVADHEVEDVAGCDPGDHEDAEEDVADGGEAEILEALCELWSRVRRRMYNEDRGELTGRKRSTTSMAQRMKLATFVWWYP